MLETTEATVTAGDGLSASSVRIARWVAWLALLAAASTVAVGLAPGASDLPPTTHVLLAAPPVLAAAGLLRATGNGSAVWLRTWSVALVAFGVMSVLALGLVLGDGHGESLGYLSIALLLSALLLDARAHVVVLVVASAGGLAITARAGLAEHVWLVLPAITVGVIAGLGAHAYRRSLVRLEQQRRLAASSSAAFRAVADAIGTTMRDDVQEVFDAITAAATTLGNDMSGLYLLDPDGVLRFASTHQVPAHLLDEEAATTEGNVGKAVRTGRTVVDNDYARSSTAVAAYRAVGMRCSMNTPVTVGDEVVGVLATGRLAPEPYDEVAVEAFELMATHAGRSIALARAIGEDRATLASLQRLRSLQEDFVSTVSHELRTPLTVIDGVAETLAEHHDALDPAIRTDLLERLASNARSLSSVVTSILDLSRLDRGLAEFTPEAVQLRPVVDGCATRLQPMLAAHQVSVEVPDVVVTGDEPLLERVVENLLLNAARHTPPGTTVRVTARPAGDDRVVVAVSDDGPGIPARELGGITERFRRGGAATAEHTRGLGIGLALVEQIVQLHGSTLSVDSTVGRGTCFAFSLAAFPAEPESADDTVREPGVAVSAGRRG